MLKLRATIILILLSIISVSASTYYVDQVNGNNNNTGLSTSSAWKTITKVNSFAFLPGDNILFRAGQTWREKIYFTKSGNSASRITFGAYGDGEKPVINGSDLITGFTQYSGNIWKSSVTITFPQQLFYDNQRGIKKASIGELISDKNWYYDATAKILYIYSLQNPSLYSSPGIEASNRDYAIYVTADYVTVKDLQIEKTSQSAITFSGNADYCIIDNITMYQWTNEENSSRAGVLINGNYCSVLNSTFGKNTGDDISDQNWAGYIAIMSYGKAPEIANNHIYHNSTENENKNGNFTAGIKVNLSRGTTKVYGNYLYHTGSNAIFFQGYSVNGDIYEIYNNEAHYSGQAGISLYKTRSSDGIGGKGYVYGNKVTFSNRLGGDVGGNGNQSAGIHFNDGIQSGTEASKPFMKWYCYENSVRNSQALKIPNGQDSDGIALDFNANNVEVYRNILFNNYGKGLYIWNADNCKVYYNIIYGNDAGCTVTAQNSGGETTNNNQFYNNTFYKNYNGSAKGPNYNTEIWFGGYGDNNIFRNNIIYASANGFGYYFAVSGSEGCIADNNIVYSEGGLNATVGYDTQIGRQTFTQWRKNHPNWDANSINADPLFVNADQFNFSLAENSPAINNGVPLGLSGDYSGEIISGTPDIGAFEFADRVPPALKSIQIIDDVTVEVAFSKVVNVNDLQTAGNYSISGGVRVNSAEAQPCSTKATLKTTEHNSGTFTLSAANIKDYSGNVINSSSATGSYNFLSVPSDTIIRISAEQGNLSGSAATKVQAGSLSAKAVYFAGSTGSVSVNINIPKAGNWFLWGRMYYGNTSRNNSFNVSANNTSSVLGDDSTKYNRWHYDGYRHAAIQLGYLTAGQKVITITPGEAGETVLLDQVLVTLNQAFIPQDEPSVMPVSLVSPSANAVNQPVSVKLTWNKDDLAQSYGVQVSTDPRFSNNVFYNSTAGTSLDINNLSYSGVYYWRVKSIGGGIESDWSETRSFTCKSLSAPILLTPAISSADQPLQVRLVWSKVNDAKSYILNVSADSAFSSIILSDSSVTDTNKTISGLSYNKKYFWRVSSKDNQYISVWSPVWSFNTKSLSSVVQLMPSDNSAGQALNTTLIWKKNDEANAYRLQVSTDPVFDSTFADINSITDTSKTLSGLSYGMKYYWRVSSISGSDISEWSPVWNFTCKTMSAVVQALPADNSTNQPLQLVLKWNRNEDASSYSLQVSTDPAFGTFVLNENAIVDTFKSIASLQYGSKYYWRIRSIDNQFASPWSSAWSFTCKILQASGQLLPQNNSMDLPVQVTLTWNKNSDAKSYGLQISQDSLFNSFVLNDASVIDTFKTVNNLINGQRYYWRINSKDNSASSGWSTVWNFTCKLVTELASPLNNTDYAYVNPILKWNKSAETGAVYFLQVSKTEDFNTVVINDTVYTDTIKTLSSLAYNTKYYWRVKSAKGIITSEWTSAWSFRTMPLIIPASPLNNSVEVPLDIAITWFKEASATGYQLQVSKAENFETLVVNDSLISDTTKMLSSLDYAAKYYWRVRYNKGSFISDWSQVFNFSTITGNTMLFRGMDGTLSGDVRLGSMTGMKSTRALYFVGTKGGSSFTINIPKNGQWYLWARMYYMSSGGKNSFLATVNGKAYIVGDDDNSYNKWHWDGYGGTGIKLGNLAEGNISVVISGREPGLTLWLDQFILTDDPNFNPNISLSKPEEITGVEEQQEIPNEFGLSQNYPNPFNPSTTIRFAIPHEEHTTLKVYDILGAEVATLVNESLPAGTYNFNFNASDLASGIYIYQVRAGSFVKTCKMQLLK